MYYGDDTARTFELNLDDATEISTDGTLSDFSKAKVGDKLLFSITHVRHKYKHPNYRPNHVMLITEGPLKK